LFTIFWGTPSQPGSLCNIREYINWKQVNKSASVSSVEDEFVIHAFKAHVLASICTYLKIGSPEDDIEH